MNNGLSFVVLAFALSGIVVGQLTTSESFADQPVNKPEACEPENPGKAIGNKHCTDSGSSKFTECDIDSSGAIEADELSFEWENVDDALNEILKIEILAESKGKDKNGTIDTEDELDLLNKATSSSDCT